MLTADDPNLFLRDFGSDVVAGSITGLGILDLPGKIIAGGSAVSTDYCLTCRTDLFGGLHKGAAISVAAVNYKVREAIPQDDGVFCHVFMSKV